MSDLNNAAVAALMYEWMGVSPIYNMIDVIKRCCCCRSAHVVFLWLAFYYKVCFSLLEGKIALGSTENEARIIRNTLLESLCGVKLV